MKQRRVFIKKKDLKMILILLLAPLILTFIIEHFGNFKYHANTNGQNLPVSQINILTINFHTPFGSTVWTDGNGYTYNDTVFKDGKFHTYFNKVPYYLKGLTSDIIYPISVSFILMGLFLINKKFKFTLTS